MHRFVYYNREILPNSEIDLPAISSAALYGRGVFTTLAIYDRKPFLWTGHWRRLVENAGRIGVDIFDFSEETVKNALFETIEKNNAQTARARITFFDASPGAIWTWESADKTCLLIQTADLRNVSGNLRLTVSPFPVNSGSPLVNIKSCNYLEPLLALEDAKAKKFDEAIRRNERGEIVSACLANIFWIKDEKLFTPAVETGCLAGTTREFLIESAAKKGIRTFFVKENLDELLSADEVFLTSAGFNIALVDKIGEKSFKNDLSQRLKKIFAQ